MARRVLLILLAGLSAVPADANWIYAYDTTGAYSLDQWERKVQIQSAGTFKFYALEGAVLGIIDSITVSENVTGTVHLYVVRNIGTSGAASVKEIDLSNAEWSVLHDVEVASLGDPNKSPITANVIEGPITVQESPIAYGDILNDIDVTHLQGDIECASMQDLSAIALPTLTTPVHWGNIAVRGPYDGTIYIEGPMSEESGEGEIWIKGPMSGIIQCTDNANSINLQSYQGVSGSVIVGGDLGLLQVSSDGDLRGLVDVGRVEDADISEGFGSVYFSADGPRSERDICLATCTAATGIRPAAGSLATLNGAFYVTGK